MLKVALPDTFNGKEVEVIILPLEKVSNQSQVQEPQAAYENLYGSLKSGLSIDEIDEQLKSLRNEWNRDIS